MTGLWCSHNFCVITPLSLLHVHTDWRDLYNLGAWEKEQTPFYCFKSLFPLWALCDKFCVFIIGCLCQRLSQFPKPRKQHGSLIMASILPRSIIHYPFLKINILTLIQMKCGQSCTMSPFFSRVIHRCIGSILQALSSIFVTPNHVYIIQEPIHSILYFYCGAVSVKILSRFNGPNPLPPGDHSKRILKHFLIYFLSF